MNNYIKIPINNRNELRAYAKFKLTDRTFDNISVKIDTGCPYTSIPILKLGISQKVAENMKEADSCNESIEKTISFGVNDSERKRAEDKKLFKNKEYMKLTSVSFKHKLNDLCLNEMILGDYDVKVSYNRTGNILIGMDILKDWDIHIGKGKNGDNVFLACPQDRINRDYLDELELLIEESGFSDAVIIT